MADQAVRNTFPRGTQAEFRFGFVRKGGAPIVPIDPLRFPSFAIENPAGIQVQTGVAQAFGDPGSYRVLWTVPEDAMLSDDQSYWIIKGLLVDTKKKQFEFKSPFRVTEQRKPTQESRDVVLMGIENTPFRATWTGDFVPASISVSCFLSSAPDAPDTSPLPNAIVPSGPMVSNGDIVYYVDLPAPALKAGMYTLLWNVQTSASASTDIDYQQLRVISRSVLQFIPQVKFITGRFQAAFDLPNFISDADYVEGLNHGLDFINQWHPISWYSISDMLRTGPNGTPLQNFWIMASAWWVLHSQHLVENSLAFNMCLEENSLVATSRGLVKIKNLDHDRLISDMRKNIVRYAMSDESLDMLHSMLDQQALSGFGYTADDIIDAFDFDVKNQALSSLLTKVGLAFFRENHNPRTWDVMSSFYEELGHRLGIESHGKLTRKFATEHVLSTPCGVQEPKHVWDLGDADTIRVSTFLGYSIEGTKDHVVPVLTADLDVTEKTLGDVAIGSYLLVKRDGFGEEKTWEVDLTEAVEVSESYPAARKNDSNTAIAQHALPAKMTKSLARVLGYLVSEGWLCRKNYIFGFCNSDTALIDDFLKHWKKAFGFDLPEQTATNYFTVNDNYVRYFGMASARVFRFLVAIGFSEHQAPKKEIPWCILQSPKKYVRHFLQTFFEGDGCYSVVDKGGYSNRQALFCSSSNTLRSHIQQTLLRFGIVSSNPITTDATVKMVSISGADLNKYAELIGFWRKGSDHVFGDLFYTQKTGVPAEVLTLIRKIGKGSNGRGWCVGADGKSVRVQLGYGCRDPKHPEWTSWYAPNQKTISLERFKAYFEFNRDLIQKWYPSEFVTLQRYYDICDKYVFVPITSWESGHTARVYDPALPGTDHAWSHYFYANGIVTHNSGASTSLDYDRTSGIDAAMGRLREEMTQNLTPAKVAFKYRSQGIGSLSVRPNQLRSYQSRVWRIESGPGNGVNGPNSQLMQMLNVLGISP